MSIVFILEMVLSHLSSMVKSYFQQFVVDAWANCEHRKLNWARTYQHTLRSELYQGLQDTADMIGMMEKMLGLWDANLFFLLLMWGVLGS